MNKTSIEWCDFTANPLKFKTADGRVVWACEKLSAGCTNCYAEHLSTRYGGARRAGDWNAATMAILTPFLDEAELGKMLRFKAVVREECEWCMGGGSDPTGADHLTCGGGCRGRGWKERGARVFVGDMTDIFGEWVPDALLDRLFAAFALRPDVTFQILTKRAERMRDYMRDPARHHDVTMAMQGHADTGGVAHLLPTGRSFPRWPNEWPLPNVWLGASTENQPMYDARIGALLRTPAAVRFLSIEPMLSAIDLRMGGMSLPDYSAHDPLPQVDWIIVGGESGPSVRPTDLAWARAIVQQCQAAGVPVFVKQLGAVPMVTHEAWVGAGGKVRLLNARNHPRIPTGFEPILLRDRKGGDPSEWPSDLRVREFPHAAR